jgi:7-cyano-7-deazaguanine reductase
MNNIHKDLRALGVSADNNQNDHTNAVSGEIDSFDFLEAFPSPAKRSDMNPNGVSLAINIRTSEFTSLCPMTGQPDFATIIIDYIPDLACVESKSIKLYFLSFRNRRDFHESCIVTICNDLVGLLEPKWIKVVGEFTPRGGIPFWPTCEYTKPE